MKNKMIDLNNHLFAQLERLSDENLTDEELEREAKRARAIKEISSDVIKLAEVSLSAMRYKFNAIDASVPLPDFYSLEK